MNPITYYISSTDGNDTNSGLTEATPFKTIAPINNLSATLSGKDTILFKREDVFPGMVLDWPTAGYTESIQIATYGNGNKPVFDMYKYVNANAWTLHAPNVWKVDLSNVANFNGWTSNPSGNAGFLKVNGEIFGMKKKNLADLALQWDFWDDGATVYVFSISDPGIINGSGTTEIAISVMGSASIRLWRNADVFDIAIIGHGGNAVLAYGGSKNLSFNHLEIREIGGSTLTTYTPDPTVRFGNGIEFSGGGKDSLVQGCDFETIYDVAMTCQETSDPLVQGFENITFRHNRTYKAEQAFEVYSLKTGSFFRNIKFHDNVCEQSGYGPLHFGHQAGYGYPQFLGIHILLQRSNVDLDGVEIFNNTFDGAANGLYFWAKPNNLPQMKLVNSHDNDIYLNEGQKLLSINETWKIEDHAQFVAANHLEIGSNFYVVNNDIPDLVEILHEHIAQGSKVTTVGDSVRDTLSIAYRALVAAEKNSDRIDKIVDDSPVYNSQAVSSATPNVVVRRDNLGGILHAPVLISTLTNQWNDARTANIVYQATGSGTSPGEPLANFNGMCEYFGDANKGVQTAYDASGTVSFQRVYWFGTWRPWLSGQGISVANPNALVKRDSLGGILHATVAIATLVNDWNDARTANIVYQANGIGSPIGEPSLDFNGMCEYLGDTNKGVQLAYDSSGTVVYQRVYWFGTWRPWQKMLDSTATLKGENIVNLYRIATDANYSITEYNSYHLLPTVSSDRVITLPATISGKTITIFNINSSNFKWSTNIRMVDNNGANVYDLPPSSVTTLVATNDNTLWRIGNLYKGNNATTKYTNVSAAYTLTPGVQDETLVMDGTADYTVSIPQDAKTPAGVIKTFKNAGNYVVTLYLGTGVTVNNSNAVVKVFPNQELTLVSESASSWKISSGAQTIVITGATGTITKNGLNSTYPFSRYEVTTKIIFIDELSSYERISETDWTVQAINLLA